MLDKDFKHFSSNGNGRGGARVKLSSLEDLHVFGHPPFQNPSSHRWIPQAS